MAELGRWCHLPVTQYVFLPCSFAHVLFWLATTFGVLYYQAWVVPDDGSGGSLDRAMQAVGFQHRAWAVPSSLWYKAASAQSCFACLSS